MATTSEKSTELLNATAELTVAGRKVRLEMPVSAGPVRLAELLPLFRSMTDAFVEVSVANARAEGLEVSCKKGCGACCRQLVPIAEIEARRLREVVEALPEPRKSTILARFEDARQRLARAGLLEKLRQPRQFRDEEVIPFGMDYFQQGIACPFLEEESCSIYTERPLACREYLVVTPAEHCAAPTVESVTCVKLVLRTARAVRGLNAEHSEHGSPWVALILALEWADAHPDQSSPQPGPAWVREAFSRLTGHEVPEIGT
ncbi:MAG: YkgJ family cysteine cluster protein [Candidatus Contendobacter sp.]|nr:YkgJ family cysteine cluster protein [Candidatus Contendobacter sp.]MDG4558401.1 YkgJ family cysteine cluster protein [Candidatus Contendobacter sp.]